MQLYDTMEAYERAGGECVAALGMFDGVHSPIFPILDPERTSRKIIRAIERNKDFRGIPWSFHFIRLMQGICPTAVFDFLFGKCFGIFSAMDNFTGRKN